MSTLEFNARPNQVTGANAGGVGRFQIRALRTARIAQFNRSPGKLRA